MIECSGFDLACLSFSKECREEGKKKLPWNTKCHFSLSYTFVDIFVHKYRDLDFFKYSYWFPEAD